MPRFGIYSPSLGRFITVRRYNLAADAERALAAVKQTNPKAKNWEIRVDEGARDAICPVCRVSCVYKYTAERAANAEAAGNDEEFLAAYKRHEKALMQKTEVPA